MSQVKLKQQDATQVLRVNAQGCEDAITQRDIELFEGMFSVIADVAKIGYCKWDVLQKRGFALRQWYKNLCEDPDCGGLGQILGRLSNIHIDDRLNLLRLYGDLVSGRITSLDANARVVCPRDGGVKWIHCYAVISKFEPENNSIEIVGASIDITSLKQLEHDLEEARSQASNLSLQRDVVQSNISTAVVHIDKDSMVQWSTTMGNPLFSSINYIAGQKCFLAFNRTEPCDFCPMTQMMATKKPAKQEVVVGDQTYEAIATPSYGADGQIEGSIIKLDNVTEQRLSQRTIGELNQLMSAILDNVPIYLFVKDPNNDFKYLYWNRAMSRYTGVAAQSVIGGTDFEAFPRARDAQKFRNDDLRLLAHGETIELDESYMDAYGVHRDVHTTKVLVPTGDKLPLVMGVSWDITEMKEYQRNLIAAKDKAEESDKFKSSFIANMGHEIRTPLNAIVGFSELLTDPTLDEQDRKEYVTIIQKNNQLLLQLISDILDLSKMEARMLEFHYDQVDMHALCNRIVTLSNRRPELKVPVVFTTDMEDITAFTDENRVHQVITNFVNNAIKFTSQGKIEILAELVEDGTMLEISVRDNGAGIPEEKINAVFERFVKLNSFVQGTGLGLSICKNLVEQLGGKIGVESQVGVGSRFWFTLPYNKV